MIAPALPKISDPILDGFEPIADVPPLGHRVHGKLEELIITRALPPRARLVEEDLARMLGVSRGPVRTALYQLAADGFVDLRPRQGAFVREPSRKEIDDFYDIRRVLEGESARLAALRITPEGAKRLQDCLDAASVSLAGNRDPSEAAPGLHVVICAIADNNELKQYLALHGKRSVWYRPPFEPDVRRRTWDEHVAIVRMIVRGDAMAAATAMQAHIDGARTRNQRLLTTDGA